MELAELPAMAALLSLRAWHCQAAGPRGPEVRLGLPFSGSKAGMEEATLLVEVRSRAQPARALGHAAGGSRAREPCLSGSALKEQPGPPPALSLWEAIWSSPAGGPEL